MLRFVKGTLRRLASAKLLARALEKISQKQV